VSARGWRADHEPADTESADTGPADH
jgi:hypothetical protein